MNNILLTAAYDDLKGGAKFIFDAIWAVYGFIINMLIGSMEMAGELFQGGGAVGSLESIGSSLLTNIKDNVILALQPAAIAIALVFFLITIIQMQLEREITLEQFIKVFGKLLASLAAILYCDELVTQIYEISTALATFFAGVSTNVALGVADGAANDISGDLKDGLLGLVESDTPGILEMLGLALKVLPMCLLLFVVSLGVFVITYLIGFTRLLELTVRAGFMPLALAMLSDDGWRGAGGRYIRKFLAVCCQSSVLILISSVTLRIILLCFQEYAKASFVPGGGFVSGGANELIGIALPFITSCGAAMAGCSLMFKSISIINDVFGG